MLLPKLRALLAAHAGALGGRAELLRLLGGLAALPALSSRIELLLELALFCCQPTAAVASPEPSDELALVVGWDEAGASGTVPPALIGSYLLLRLFRSCAPRGSNSGPRAPPRASPVPKTAKPRAGPNSAPRISRYVRSSCSLSRALQPLLAGRREAQPHILAATFDALAQEDLGAEHRSGWIPPARNPFC